MTTHRRRRTPLGFATGRPWLGLLAALAAIVIAAVLPATAGAQPGFGDVTPVEVRAVAEKSIAHPGDPLVIAVVLDHGEGFHTWPNEPTIPPELGVDFPAIATTIDVASAPEGTEVRAIQWPEAVPVTVYYTLEPLELISYTGEAIAYVPVIIPPDQAPGDTEIELLVSYQSCDETTCYFPEDKTVRVPIEIVPAGQPGAASVNEPALFEGFDSAQFTVAVGGEALADGATREPLRMNVFGYEFEFNPYGPAGLLLLLLVAALGGFLLNLTPCVLPVIPLKIMGLSQAAGNPRRMLMLGAVMSAGVIAFWLVLGAAIAFIAGFDAISSLFQTGWFSLIVGIVVGVMAIGMMGVFSMQLPQTVYKVRPSQETVHGSFLFGIMTAVLSTPCTAPFMGAAAAWAATQDPQITMLTFAAIGAGMALPYLLLSARPGLVSQVPRSGPGSEVVKQVLGLMMLAVAAFFIGLALSAALQQPPDPPTRLYWWPVAFFIIAAVVWLAYKTYKLSESRRLRAVTTGLAVVVTALSLYLVIDLTGPGPIDWTYYTEDRFATSAQAGEVVVLDFTAEWCLNCRALESGVLHQDAVAEMLGSEGVVPMRVDLTGDNPEGKAKLKALEWVGIPLLAVFGPGTGYEEPLKFDTYTPRVVLDAVEQARGGDGAN